MKDYTINNNTLALIPLGKYKTVVYEDHDCYIIEESTSKIMDSNCVNNGSSLEGRVKGTYALTGFTYKAPIIMSEEKDLVLFPTSSPRLKNCAWVNVNNINKIHNKDEKDKCLVEFLNDECLELDASYRIINNQYLKSLSLKNAFKNKKKN